MRACEREGVPKCLQNAGAFLIAFRLLLLYFETTVCGLWSRNAWIRRVYVLLQRARSVKRVRAAPPPTHASCVAAWWLEAERVLRATESARQSHPSADAFQKSGSLALRLHVDGICIRLR